ncbi:carbohydrate ABC transporter permease [Paenibacillus thermotolerans]|uniref:carbohydrate ABC transporter permease n=1 Tax=Paenibacillus thermotolerans TaxID=3027807 RepID=UPI002368D232|nr:MULTISPECIES: sugar ABC transporter permease [unclassified Paenibacillus]
MKRRSYSLERQKVVEGYAFVSIWIIGFLAFMLYPLYASMKISLTEAKVNNLLNGTWNQFAHYKTAIADVNFFQKYSDQLVRSLIDAPLISVFSLIAAVLMNGNIAGKRFWRTVYFTPIIISGLMISILNSNGASEFSLIDQFGGAAFLIADFVGEETFSRMGELLWKSCVEILIFLAGLQSVSRSLYEAAQIDGASPWECFWKITLPSMAPIVILTIIYALIDSFTDPGNLMLNLINDWGLGKLQFGVAAAVSWIYFLSVLAIVLVLFAIGRRLLGSDKAGS